MWGEGRSGGGVGEAVVTKHDRRGWLLLDQPILADSRRRLRASTLWFQLMQAVYLLNRARVSAPTIEAVAAKAGVGAQGLAATLPPYNKVAAEKQPDPLRQPAPPVPELRPPPDSPIYPAAPPPPPLPRP